MSNEFNNLRTFGKFRLDTEKKLLWFENEQVNVALKEIELLCVLTETDEMVTKDELMNRVWKDSFVEESNISKHIYRLRKTLAEYGESENIIETVPKRGYRFIGKIENTSNSHDLIIEKHSITKTIVEEVDDESSRTYLLPSPKRNRYLLPVLACLVFLTMAFGIYSYFNKTQKIEGIKTIAIGQIQSLSNNENELTLALGIKEKLLMNLGNLQDLTVQNVQIGESEIDKLTTADAVLFGSVQRVETKVRVNLRLLKVADKKQIWATSFDKNEAEIFQLQDELSQNITDSLSINLSKNERERIYKRYTENEEAYQHYLRGRFFHDKRNSQNYLKAIAEFKQAIELDRNFALAYSGLADVYPMQDDQTIDGRSEMYQEALKIAEKALKIDPDLAEAHTSIAWIKRNHKWNWDDSEKHFKRAIELNPNYYNARQWYAHFLSGVGRLEEALIQNDKARQIEPLSKVVLVNRQAQLIFLRRYDEALKLTEQFIQMDDDIRANARLHSIALLNAKQDEKVIEVVEKYIQEKGDLKIGDQTLSNLATAYFRTGKFNKANELFEMLEQTAKQNSEVAFRLAQAYSDIGKKDEAIAHLQRCYNDHDDRMVWLKVEPRFDNIRKDARFQELLRKMNLQ